MSLFRRIQQLATGVLLLFFLFAGALFALPYVVPQKEIRETVTRALAAVTRVVPRIESDARFSILPRPSVRFDDIHFDGSERTDLSAGSLRATISLLPLLFGKIEVASLVFEQPRLNIEIGPDGTTVLGLPPRAPALTVQSPDLPQISILNGTIALHFEGSERIEIFSSVNALLDLSRSALTTSGSFLWRKRPTTASLFIADPSASEKGVRSDIRLKLKSESLRIGFEGGLAFRNGIQADGVLSIDSENLHAAFAALTLEPPTRGGFGPFSMKAQAQLTPTALALSGLTAKLDGNLAEGALTLAIGTARPTLQGTLASEIADFTPYASGFSATVPGSRDWSSELLDISGLTSFDLDLRLSSKKVIFKKMEFEKAALTATIKNGRFSLSVGGAQAYGGMLRAVASMGPSQQGAEFKFDANVKNFDAEKGFGDIADVRQLEGIGSLSLTVMGAGKSVNAIAHSITGSADVELQNGALNGINVEQVLRRLGRRPLSVLTELRGGRTLFDRFVTRLMIAQGIADFEQSQIESPAFRVTLAGRASIPKRSLDLHGTASLKRVDGAGDATSASYDLPFLIRGSWDDPSLLLDTATLIRRSHAAPTHLDAAKLPQ